MYEGCGWTREGAHTYGYNKKSVGIGFIGNFESKCQEIKRDVNRSASIAIVSSAIFIINILRIVYSDDLSLSF